MIYGLNRSSRPGDASGKGLSARRNASLSLLDPTRVHAADLPAGRQIRWVCPLVIGGGDAVKLDSLLAAPARSRKVTWTVDGGAVTGARWSPGREPEEDHVSIHEVAVADSQGARDEFSLVLIPSTTASNFAAWSEVQRKDMRWLDALPPVYSSLLPGGATPEPDGCQPKRWPVLRRIQGNYHPGAAYEMRSAIQADGSAHQATYDAAGKLLRVSPAAGTADRASPRQWNLFRMLAHRDQDVIPFVWAAQLDGNPVNPKMFYRDLDAPLVREGDHLRAYLTFRPAFHHSRQEVPPGVCIQ